MKSFQLMYHLLQSNNSKSFVWPQMATATNVIIFSMSFWPSPLSFLPWGLKSRSLFTGTEVEMNRPFLEDNRMSKIRHKYSQIKIQIDSQKATLDSLNQNLTHFKNASVIWSCLMLSYDKCDLSMPSYFLNKSDFEVHSISKVFFAWTRVTFHRIWVS